MTYLLDVNVLLAMMDAQHVAHDDVHAWFAGISGTGWATCPITENGFIRILSNPKYPNNVQSAAEALEMLVAARAVEGHEFWADDLSLASCAFLSPTRLLSTGQVTDTYLLALAKKRQGRLATLDRRLVTDAVEDGRASNFLIPQRNPPLQNMAPPA